MLDCIREPRLRARLGWCAGSEVPHSEWAASDLVNVWLLLRPNSLQLCEPRRPSNYGSVMAYMRISGKKHDVTLNMTVCSMCSHAVTNDDEGLVCNGLLVMRFYGVMAWSCDELTGTRWKFRAVTLMHVCVCFYQVEHKSCQCYTEVLAELSLVMTTCIQTREFILMHHLMWLLLKLPYH